MSDEPVSKEAARLAQETSFTYAYWARVLARIENHPHRGTLIQAVQYGARETGDTPDYVLDQLLAVMRHKP